MIYWFEKMKEIWRLIGSLSRKRLLIGHKALSGIDEACNLSGLNGFLVSLHFSNALMYSMGAPFLVEKPRCNAVTSI